MVKEWKWVHKELYAMNFTPINRHQVRESELCGGSLPIERDDEGFGRGLLKDEDGDEDAL